MRSLAIITIVAALLGVANTPLFGCSLTGCVGHGIEMGGSFRVHVTVDGKPLPGVFVSVTSMAEAGDPETRRHAIEVQAETDSLGEVQVGKLPPGNYWIHATLLGFQAGDQCFHVNKKPLHPKRSFDFTWGDYAEPTRAVAGTVVISKPGPEQNPIQSQIHRADVPLASAQILLTNALTKQTYRSATSSDGGFILPDIPDGTYVFAVGEHITDASDKSIILKVTAKASQDHLVIRSIETMCSTGLELIR